MFSRVDWMLTSYAKKLGPCCHGAAPPFSLPLGDDIQSVSIGIPKEFRTIYRHLYILRIYLHPFVFNSGWLPVLLQGYGCLR